MEYYNPYTYVGNHPMNFVDPLGIGLEPNSGGVDDGRGGSGGGGWDPGYLGSDWRNNYIAENGEFNFCSENNQL